MTRFLFVTTQVASLFWITATYLIAIYATVRLGQVFPVVELSQNVVVVLLGNGTIKMFTNMAEHNDGVVFGTSNTTKKEDNEEATISVPPSV